MAAIWRRGAWRSSKLSSTGRGGGSPQLIFGSTTTTSAGTTLSTATYTTSSDPTGEGPPLVVEENAEEGLDQERAMALKEELVRMRTRRHMRDLVEEFCADPSGNAAATARWLSELHVPWLLHLAELDASAQRIFISRQLQHLAQSWIRALSSVINASIWGCFCSEEEAAEATAGAGPPAPSEFLRFFEATLLKMFTFVHAMILAPLDADDDSISCCDRAAEKLVALLDVREALSTASEQIMVSLRSSHSVQQSTRITDDMGGLLSAELGKLDQAVCDTVDQIRAAVMSSLNDDDGSSSWGTLQSSPDIHKVTRSVINVVNVLSASYWSVDPIITNHGPGHGSDMRSLTSLIKEMVRSLEEELARVSLSSFPDKSLRFLFLINNSYFMRQQLRTSWPLHYLTHKIDRYIQSYLQVSWEPVSRCLHNRPNTLLCFTRNSPLPEFQSRFQATYAAQKLWKVPDPELRKRLRGAITDKVASGFAKYLELEDNNNSITPGVALHEIEEMLQELFEG